MPEKKITILDHQKIEQKINRIAYQIFEDHYDHQSIVLVGIAESGYILAELIAKKLAAFADLKVILSKLTINKKNPLRSKIDLEIDTDQLKNQSIVVVDDVLNSGQTMMYAIKPLLEKEVKKISLAVLINRNHKRFPIYAEYVGLFLSTTLKEHIEVNFKKGDFTAHLS